MCTRVFFGKKIQKRSLNSSAEVKPTKNKKKSFKITRALEEHSTTIERERERERPRAETLSETTTTFRRRRKTRRSHDDARTRIQLFARGTLPNHPTRTPGVDDTASPKEQQQQQQQFDVSKTLLRSKDDEYYHDDDGPKDDDE